MVVGVGLMPRKAKWKIFWWNYPGTPTPFYFGTFEYGGDDAPWLTLWDRRSSKTSALNDMLLRFETMPPVLMTRTTFPKATVTKIVENLRKEHYVTLLADYNYRSIDAVGGKAKPVMTPNGRYKSTREAAKAWGISAPTVRRRIDTEQDWYFVD